MSKNKKKFPNINSRDFPTILGINPYQTAFQLLESKVEGKYPFFGNKFTEHGNRYEKLAIKTFESIIGIKVDTQQINRKHPEFEWVTGRFDGIIKIQKNEKNITNFFKKIEKNENPAENSNEIPETNLENDKKIEDIKRNEITESIIKTANKTNKTKKRKRDDFEDEIVSDIKTNILSKKIKRDEYKIVEVKCPFKKDRKEPLTLSNIPKHYWVQCQVYMQMAGADSAYYIEYYIEPDANKDSGILYYINVPRDDIWWKKGLPKIKKFYEEMKKYCRIGSLDTHPVRICENNWKKDYSLETIIE